MKLIKIAFSLITIVILLIVVAAIALPQLVNPNDYKSQITDAITQHTGLNARIEGDLSLSVFPWLGVSTGQVVLQQPKVIQTSVPDAGNFVDVSAIDIRVKLLPLLSKKVEVDTVLLKQPLIEFVVNKAGKNSLSGLQAATTNTAANTTTETPNTAPNGTAPTSTDTPAAIVAFSIAGVDISDGQLIFNDKQAGIRYELSDLTIQSGNILEASAPFSISTNVSGTNIEPISLTLNSDLSLNKDTMAATLRRLNLSVKQLQNTADVTLASLDYQPAKNTLIASDLNLSAEAEGYPLELSIPSVTANLSTAIASIESFSANSHNLTLTGNVDVKNWQAAPMAIGRIRSNTFDAQALLKKLAIDYTPSKASALSALSVETQFNATANGAALQNITANIDNTTLTGDASIVNFASPRYSFDLALSDLIVDDYLPVGNASASNNEAAAPTATEALAAPIVLLKDIYANGVFRADKIVASNLTLTDNIIQVASTDKRVTITPTVNLYNGQLAGKTIVERGNTPTLLVKNTLTNVDLGPLLIDADVTDQFSGTATINTDITVTETAAKPNSKGTVKVLVKDGSIEGVDIKKVLDEAQNTIDKIRGKNIQNNTDTAEDNTRFAEMTATLLIDNDIITNNDLSMKAPVFRVNGEGSVNTAAQTLDYLTSIIVVNTNEGQGGEDLANLKGFTIPVRFSGALAAPKYAIDTKALLKANTAKTLAKEKDKLKDKLSEKLKINNTDGDETQSTEDALKDKLKKKLLDKLF